MEPVSMNLKNQLIAGLSMITISSVGLLLNTLIFRKFANRKQLSNGFFVLCFSKSISNSLICLINLLWIGPAILIGKLFLPIKINEFLGQLNEYGIYVMGPLSQILMAIDRFFIIFFPLKISDHTRCSISTKGILVFWMASAVFVAYSFKDDCWVFFNLETYNYNAHNVHCDNIHLNILEFLCFGLATVSSAIQLASLIKLLFLASKRKAFQNSSSRRGRTIRLFAQSVIQDCLHCLDMFNSRDLFSLQNTLVCYFAFTFCLVFVHATDGFIMCLFHLEWPCSKRKTTIVMKTIRIHSI